MFSELLSCAPVPTGGNRYAYTYACKEERSILVNLPGHIASMIIGSTICILSCMFGIRMCFDAEWGVNIGGLLMVAIGGAGFVPLVSSR